MNESRTRCEAEALKEVIDRPEELEALFSLPDTDPSHPVAGPAGLSDVADRYPFRLNRYFASLIQARGDPIWLQCIPAASELEDPEGWEDPLAEEALSPVPNLVHRYPDRVLWLISDECAVNCRFCTRKRRWRNPPLRDAGNFRAALDYISSHRNIRDVLLSGGDPLMLPARKLEAVLAAVRKIPHVDIIRIGTRAPCTAPARVTPALARMIARYHPVYMNVHFNHPLEITAETARACALLANAGIALGSQTVLLRGVNDRAEILGELFRKLLRMRVRPYYLLQMDLTKGTAHFRTPLSSGLGIIHSLRNHISGLAVPHFVVDLPGGKGKVPLLPNAVREISEDRLIIRDFHGELCEYPLLSGEGEELVRRLRVNG